MEQVYRDKIVLSTLGLWKKSGKQSEITISGTSMKPILSEGTQVLVKHSGRTIKIGDIVVYLRNNKLISHRVIRIKTEGENKLYLTKGDSALRFDSPPIREEDVVGVVHAVLNGQNIIDLRTRKWKFIGRILSISSLLVGNCVQNMLSLYGLFFAKTK